MTSASTQVLPRNVRRFAVLLYVSLALDALSVAFQDRTADIGDDAGRPIEALATAALILGFAALVQFAIRRRKGWPRWVLLVALVLSVLSLWATAAEVGMRADGIIETVSCVLTALGLYASFTGDARAYFDN